MATSSPLSLLALDDVWWRVEFSRWRSVKLLANRLSLHRDDVRCRLRAAGVELRGAPRRQILLIGRSPSPRPEGFTA